MSYSEQVPVVIVGSGPTGLTAGLLLAEYGVRSIILEKNAAPLGIPRAIVLDDEGLRTLQVFRADQAYLDLTVEGDGAQYIDDNGEVFGKVGAGPENFGFPKRNFINQPEFEKTLRDFVDASPLCTLHYNSNVTGIQQFEDTVTVQVQDSAEVVHAITANFVIAADGGRSSIREAANILMLGSTYEQNWIVVDTLNDPDQVRFSRFICSNQRPHVSIPAPKGGRRYEFMLLPGETGDQALADGYVENLLKPYRDIAPHDIVRKTLYTFHARIAENWRAGRVFLAGDAAHLTPPFAGQGMNAGLRDAANITWKIATVLNGVATDTILNSYQSERYDPAWSMILLAVAMGDVVMPIKPEQVAFREQLVKSMQPFPGVKDYFLNMKFKPKPRYDRGMFMGLDKPKYEASLVGEMIPQPKLDLDGQSGLLDEFLGSGFALIAQDKSGIEAMNCLKMNDYLGLPLAKLALPYKSGTGARSISPWVKPLRTHRDEILLIRPDRYCAAAFEPADLMDGLLSYEELFSTPE